MEFTPISFQLTLWRTQ